MEVVYARCAGLDVHKKSIAACVRIPGGQAGRRAAEVRTFRTTLAGLAELTAWLATHAVTHVAMESTGIYWRPVYAVLEGVVEVVLVNAWHVKMVPGRKTDVRDCEWLTQLLECGLLRASFIPPRPIRDLRDLSEEDPLEEAFLQFLSVERNASPMTLTNYAHSLRSFRRDHPGFTSWRNSHPDDFRAWLFLLMKRETGRATVRLHFSALRSFFKFLTRRQGLAVNPLAAPA